MKVSSNRLCSGLRRLRELLASCCRSIKIHPLDEDTMEINGKKIRVHTIYVRPKDQGMDATSDSTSGSGNSEASSSLNQGPVSPFPN
ncbi:Hypothetical predicted protein [Podarcis lilfordi]|uniref:Uncharacterized protein n=1 Tax=Podarcis lilfordi TaxID=74358 RepID=A0AA35KGL7_9SAUR|nr:Hypothetical predicted protein [Podarcis lilfordi]